MGHQYWHDDDRILRPLGLVDRRGVGQRQLIELRDIVLDPFAVEIDFQRKEGMDRLLSALFEIDEELEKKSEEEKRYYLPRQEQVFTSFEVEGMRRMETVRSMSWQESAGFISMEYAYLYPPGIPLIVPGERITKETAAMLVDYQNKGFSVEGMNVENYIEVLINE